MSLFEVDAYAMMRRLVPDARDVVFLDVGANEGQTCRRVREEFPSARIYAFEPSASVCERLRVTASTIGGVGVVQAAVGSSEGWCELRETTNSQFTSVLAATDAGARYHGGDIRERGAVRVPCVTLDAWAEREGIECVDLMKVDVQGAELEVLKGARRVLSSGRLLAVNCEAQIVQEYEGAATLTDIDLFFREVGFVLHQFHELWVHGRELQHSCVDALWVQRDALERLREDMERAHMSDGKRRFREAVRELTSRGTERIAVYGAGEHTRAVIGETAVLGVRVACVIDDDVRRWGDRIGGVAVVGCKAAMGIGIEAVVLSSSCHEEKLWTASAGLRAAGMEVVPLYGHYEIGKTETRSSALAASSRM